jgi:metal-dependent amidase/aminoacylase/carboxypeptidase family protein
MTEAKAHSPSPYAPLLTTHRPNLLPYESLYKHLHANGELSTQEAETSALIVSELRKLSSEFHLSDLSDDDAHLDIRTNIGGYGLIAILKNGPGPTVMLRADMDALPVVEKTGLEYRSEKRMRDMTDGVEKGVMRKLVSC